MDPVPGLGSVPSSELLWKVFSSETYQWIKIRLGGKFLTVNAKVMPHIV
mgnify:FL=1